jgi:Methyltransferase domain
MPKPFYPQDLASLAYRELLIQTHEEAPWGNKGYKHASEIRAFFNSLPRCSTILDYGCGSNTLANTCKDLDIRSYDPGVIEYSDMPEPADLVVCTDVLEHIEPDLLYNVLRHIAELAQVGIYLRIGIRLAKRTLPDGRNAHLIVEDCQWWLDKLATISDRWKVRNHVEGIKLLQVYLLRN